MAVGNQRRKGLQAARQYVRRQLDIGRRDRAAIYRELELNGLAPGRSTFYEWVRQDLPEKNERLFTEYGLAEALRLALDAIEGGDEAENAERAEVLAQNMFVAAMLDAGDGLEIGLNEKPLANR